MRLFVLLAALIGLAIPASAADLARGFVPPLPAPQAEVFARPLNLCLLGAPLSIYRAPLSWPNGILPAGLEVVVIEEDWSPARDLWVRIEAPREGIYYGWVYTRDLICH